MPGMVKCSIPVSPPGTWIWAGPPSVAKATTDDVGDVAEVDRPVGVVVGEVGDQRGHDHVDLRAVAHPLPLDVGLEAVGRGGLAAIADRIHVVDDGAGGLDTGHVIGAGGGRESRI